MDLFLSAVIFGVVLGLVSGAVDWILTRKIRRDIEELQVVMYGFNFQIAQLEEFRDNLSAKEFAKTATPARKTTAKEAK